VIVAGPNRTTFIEAAEGGRTMVKKALCGTAIAVGLGALIFGHDFHSYARTWGTSVRDAVKSEVPVEFEVERARKMIEDLVPDIRNCMSVIAEQQVDIEHLTTDINRKSSALVKQKEAIMTLRTDLDSGKSTFRYANHSYTTTEVKRDLSKRFDRFKIAEETLGRQEQILGARNKALTANQEKLENMLVMKGDLEVQIEQLEARMKAIQAAETVSTLEIDHSQLARAKKLIRELNRQLDVKEKVLDAEGKFTGLIPVEASQDSEAANDIAEQVDAYFMGESDTQIAELE
jgi:hypothetical protein